MTTHAAQRLLRASLLASITVLLAACASVNPAPDPAANLEPPTQPVDGPRAAARIAQLLPPWPAAGALPVAPGVEVDPSANPVARLSAQDAAALDESASGRDNPATVAEFDAPIDLWARIRSGFSMPDIDGALVRKWEQYYAAKPDYVQRMTQRGGRYLFHIVEEVERRGMPMEVALLPFVESAFDPQAMSRSKAAGMWQFVPATGRDFALKQNVFRDDRRDVLASTRAALDYLNGMNSRFNDWQLALAAYNWGPGSVQRAVAANARAGRPTGFADLLRVPDETRNYLPKLQAVKNIVLRPEAFGLSLPAIDNHPYFQTVAIETDIDVKLAAELADLSVEAFRELNPQMNKPVILAAGTPRVLLPYDNAAAFERNLALRSAPLSSWTAWVAPRTLKVAEAARLVGMPEPQLREVNAIPPKMLIQAKSVLLVPRGAHNDRDVADQVADGAMLSLAPEAPPQRLLKIKAGKKGETVAAVAARYKLSAAEVARLNHVGVDARFKAGQTIVVAAPAKAATTRVAAAAKAQPRAGRPARAPTAPTAAAKVRVAAR
jgi:membrane-bound lytic murein transglycosylase D